MTRSTRAVIYAPRDTDTQRWVAECLAHCERNGYDTVHVQVGGVDRHWPALARWLIEGRAEVIVAARADHLPASRTPRIEVVSECRLITVGSSTVRRRPRRTTR